MLGSDLIDWTCEPYVNEGVFTLIWDKKILISCKFLSRPGRRRAERLMNSLLAI
jgi:hypothetical protein